MYKIIFVDRKTDVVIAETSRDNFTSAAACCMANESREIECRMKEECREMPVQHLG